MLHTLRHQQSRGMLNPGHTGSRSPSARVAHAAMATGLPGADVGPHQPAAAGGHRAPPIALVGCFSESFRCRAPQSRNCSLSQPWDKRDYLRKISNRIHRSAIRQILARSCFAHARTCMLQPEAPNPPNLTRRKGPPTSSRGGRRTGRDQPCLRHQARAGQFMAPLPRWPGPRCRYNRYAGTSSGYNVHVRRTIGKRPRGSS